MGTGPQLLLCVCDCMYMITELHAKVIVFAYYGSDYQAVSKIMLYHNIMTVYSGHSLVSSLCVHFHVSAHTHTHTHTQSTSLIFETAINYSIRWYKRD